MSDVIFGFFACIASVVIVLFNVGCFTPYWIMVDETNVSNSTYTPTGSSITKTCNHGLLYSIDCPNSENVFDVLVIGLNLTISVLITIIPFLWCCTTCITRCCSDSDESCVDECCGFYSFFYTIGGFLGLVSSVLVIAKFDTSRLGWSFFLTTTATGIVLLQTVIMLTYSIYSRRSTEKCSIFLVYRTKKYYEVL